MKFGKWQLRLLAFLVALAIWQLVAMNTRPVFFSSPASTFGALIGLALSGRLLSILAVTLRTFFIGLVVSVVLGIAIGLVIGYFEPVRVAIDPYVSAFYSTPYVVWMPLTILWLGIGELAKIGIVVFAAIWPMIINLIHGINYADEGLLEVGRVFGCSSRQMMTKIVIPSSVPFIASGFRLAVGRAIVGTIVAEMFLQLVGLGGSLLRYADLLQTDRVLALIFVIMVLGLCFMVLGKWVESKSAPWKVID